jgi:hypothetical protein
MAGTRPARQPQFTTAQQLKDRYWLYVVENPALHVKSFAYYHRWQILAEAHVST